MKCGLWASVMMLVLFAASPIAFAQRSPDPRVADLVRAGKVRIALFPPQYTKDPATGELKGIWADIARAFAARIGVDARADRTSDSSKDGGVPEGWRV
jgi:ABC-type amino acid transport substrate-binding protein